MALSDEERRRIEEEERFRVEARVRAEAEARRSTEAAAQKKKSDDTKRGVIGCLAIVVIAIVITLLSESKDTSKPPPGPDADFNAKLVAEQLIDDWKRGASGATYWKGSSPQQSLYAVRDYEHVASGGWKRKDGTWEPDRAWHRYRIKSSTKGGFPIEKLWDVNLEKVGSEWKVASIREAQ